MSAFSNEKERAQMGAKRLKVLERDATRVHFECIPSTPCARFSIRVLSKEFVLQFGIKANSSNWYLERYSCNMKSDDIVSLCEQFITQRGIPILYYSHMCSVCMLWFVYANPTSNGSIFKATTKLSRNVNCVKYV